MMPRERIEELIAAAKTIPEGLPGEDKSLVHIRHLQLTLETSIETLLACEAVQDEFGQLCQRLSTALQESRNTVYNLRAELAITQRRLVVSTTNEISLDFEFTPPKGVPVSKSPQWRNRNKKR